jgi:hypothetical protein
MEMTLYGAGKTSKSDHEAPTDLREWLAAVDGAPSSKPWGEITGDLEYGDYISAEGGLGPLESSQRGFQLNADFSLNKFSSQNKSVEHSINFGLGSEQTRATFKRPVATNIYFLTKKRIDGVWQYINDNPDFIGDVECNQGATDCIDGEQVLLSRQHYAADSASAKINFIDAYIEDSIKWRQLEIRPGLRGSYDDFMDNLDIAPRLAASFDLFKDRRFMIIAGWNRYYGRTLLHYKLREASQPYIWEKREVSGDTPQPWEEWFSGRNIYKYSNLKTPYSDETVIGIDNELLGGRLKLNWVRRDGYNEFSKERTDSRQDDGYYHYTMTNLGRSHHDEYTLEWERQTKTAYLGINITYQETETTSDSYLDDYETEDLDTEVWYDGEVVNIEKIPRQDFNRPWVANLVYSTRLPLNFTFTNITKYRSGYEGLFRIVDSAEKTALGVPEEIRYAYKNAHKAGSLVFDWRIDWEKKFLNNQRFIISLEIDNVFDKKVETGDASVQVPVTVPSDEQSYELGRQFWLGMTYKF